MATMISTHGRNLRGSSNVVLYLEAVIYTTPLLYCCEIELSSFHPFVKADFCTSQWYVLFFSLSQVNICPLLQYAAFSTESTISYHEQRRKDGISVCNTELDTEEVAAKM